MEYKRLAEETEQCFSDPVGLLAFCSEVALNFHVMTAWKEAPSSAEFLRATKKIAAASSKV